MSWNWSSAKCKRRKSFDTWYNIVICATLCINFSLKLKATNVSPKKILKSNTLDKIIQARKKLFCHVIVKNYLCNVLRKFLIKFESTWRREINKKHSGCLHCTVIGLSEAASGGFLWKKLFLKSSGNTYVEVTFKKYYRSAGLKL